MTKQHETRPALWALACTTNNSQEKRPVEAPAFFGLPEATRTSRAGEVRIRGARDLTCSATTMCPPPSRAFPVSTDVSRFSRPAATSERDVEIQRSLSKRPSLVSERTNAFRSRSESRKGSGVTFSFVTSGAERCRVDADRQPERCPKQPETSRVAPRSCQGYPEQGRDCKRIQYILRTWEACSGYVRVVLFGWRAKNTPNSRYLATMSIDVYFVISQNTPHDY